MAAAAGPLARIDRHALAALMVPARLDAYGDPLPPFALARLGTVRWRHRGMLVDSLAFSRDGRTVFAAGGGLTAIDVAAGSIRWSDPDPGASHVALVPDPGGDRLATVGLGGTVALRDAASGALLRAQKLPSTSLTALAVSHDGNTLLAGGFHPFGALLERDGSARATLPLDGGMYLCGAAFAPDDATVVTTDCHGAVSLWSVAGRSLLHTFGRANLNPNDASFTPDGRQLVVATSSGVIVVFDVASGDVVARWKAHRDSISAVLVAPDGRRVVSLGEDDALSLWTIADGERLATRRAPRSGTALAISPDGETVAVSQGPRVALLDVATLTERVPSPEHSIPVQALALGRDGDTVVTVASQHAARWWSLAEGLALATVPLAHFVTALRPLPGGDRYAMMQPNADDTPVLDVAARALSSRPERFADTAQKWWGRAAEATLFRGRITLTNAAGASHVVKGIAHELAITPDDAYAVFFERNTVTAWDLARHCSVATAKARSAAGLVLSPRGDEVAVWSGAALHRFGVPDLVERAVWKAPPGAPLVTAAYSPDGALIAVVTQVDVRLLDAATHAEVGRLTGHGALITLARFDRDGGRLITASWDTTALVWSVAEALAGYAPPPVAKRAKRPRPG